MRRGIVWTFFSASIFSPFFLPVSETARYRLNKSLKGPLTPPPPPKKKKKKKKKNTQLKKTKPNPVVSTLVYSCYHIYSKVSKKNTFRSVDSDQTTHFIILDSISPRFVFELNLQNSFPAGSFPRENLVTLFLVSSPQRFFPLNFTRRSTSLHFVNRLCIDHRGG